MVEILRGLAAAAIHALAGLREIRAALDAWSPLSEAEGESDRAGRLGELRVAELFQGVSGVLVFQSLRIPDGEGRGRRREIDLVLLTKKKIYVIEVKNWSGVVEVQSDGSWCQIRRNGARQTLPNVVEETRYRAALLESYIARRGVSLPRDFIDCRVFLVNPSCRPEDDILLQREVLTSEQWQTFLDKDLERGSWMNIFQSLRKDSKSEAMHEQLSYILRTAPTWDKLHLEGGKIVVGDFLHFKGRYEDTQTLRPVKRSNVSHAEFSHSRSLLWNLLGLITGERPTVKLSCTSRDVRDTSGFLNRKGKQKSSQELTVRPDVEVVFRPVASTRPESFKVNNICGLTLSV